MTLYSTVDHTHTLFVLIENFDVQKRNTYLFLFKLCVDSIFHLIFLIFMRNIFHATEHSAAENQDHCILALSATTSAHCSEKGSRMAAYVGSLSMTISDLELMLINIDAPMNSVPESIAQVIHLKSVIIVVYYDGVDNSAVNNTFTIMRCLNSSLSIKNMISSNGV